MSQSAEIKFEGESYELPVIEGSEQEKAIDISKFRGTSGLITIDPGFKNTGSTRSSITFLDGEKGILRYRGYPIEQLADQSTFLEVSYLLIYGELPTSTQIAEFQQKITNHTLVHEDFKKLLDGFPSTSHPMGVLSSLVTALTAFYPQSLDPTRSGEEVNLSIIRIMAKMPTFAAWSYKNQMGHPVTYPDNNLDYCSNFLKMMFGLPSNDYEVDPVVAKALDKLLILHADHEQNCSASTVRIVGSSQASLYASLSGRASMLCGDLFTAGPTRLLSRCLKALRLMAETPKNGWPRPKTRMILSD